jgi:Bacterial Ig-like domain (group 1)/RTX calcium-binding nonapeptide repeat (4 copies)
MNVAGAWISRKISQSIVLTTALVTIVALVLPMAGVALANHGTRTLQVTPETDDNPVSTTHTVTATLDAAVDATSGTINIDFEVNGPGDPETPDAYSPTSPDFSCDVTSGSSCTISYSSTVVGTDQIDGWIDHDKNNATLTGELDQAEGPDAGNPAVDEPSGGVDAPGGIAEPDTTDVVTKTWVTALPSGTVLDCDDASGDDTETNPVTGAGSRETYTCTVIDTAPNPDVPVSGARIDAENLNGANDPDNSAAAGTPDFNDACTTGGNGKCTITIAPTESQAGPADICFWIDEDVDNMFDPAGVESDGGDCEEPVNAAENDDKTDTVIKTWGGALAPRNIDARPEAATNAPGTVHRVTAIVTDREGDPVSGVTVTFTESGVGTFVGGGSTATATTDDNGRATAEVTTQTTEIGTQTITASLPTSGGVDECERAAGDPAGAPAGNCSDQVTKTWAVCPGFEGDPRNQVVGTSGDDELVGTAGRDIICGRGGDDVIRARGGRDLVLGGAGDDRMRGGAGNDKLRGGRGPDTAIGGPGTDVCRSARVKRGCER